MPPFFSLTRSSTSSASSAGASAPATRGSQLDQRSGLTHSAQTPLAGLLELALFSASNRTQLGSGEPAKAKNQISIAIEATIAVPTKTASTGLSLLVPGR